MGYEMFCSLGCVGTKSLRSFDCFAEFACFVDSLSSLGGTSNFWGDVQNFLDVQNKNKLDVQKTKLDVQKNWTSKTNWGTSKKKKNIFLDPVNFGPPFGHPKKKKKKKKKSTLR